VGGIDAPETVTGTVEMLGPLYTEWNRVSMYFKSMWTPRTVRVAQADSSPAGKLILYVDIDQLGNETAAGFTLGFDPALLQNPVVSLGNDANTTTVLTTNTSKSGDGQLAILVDSSEPLSSTRLVAITFDVAESGAAGAASVKFTDAITKGSISDVEGNLLPTRFVDTAVTISN
jgi:hypothetical protein